VGSGRVGSSQFQALLLSRSTEPRSGTGDPAAQARRCFEIIDEALHTLGADITHVIRTRVLLTRIEDWEVVAAVHGEFFRNVRPASTVVQVSRFIDPAWLIEVEADAVVP
jgi:enamine deaminase RidA (YjgF/YER057c/UK114 family)